MSRRERDILRQNRRFALLVGDDIVERVAEQYWRHEDSTTEWVDLPDVVRDPVRELVGPLLDTAVRESTEPAAADDPAASVRAIHTGLQAAHKTDRITDYAHRPRRDLDYRLQIAYRHLEAAEQALSGLWVDAQRTDPEAGEIK